MLLKRALLAKTRVLIGLLATAVLGVASLALAQATHTLTIRLQEDMSTLDPAHIGQSTDHALGYLIYNGLVQYAPGSLKVIPDLATSWDVSADGTVYTFHLRKGVQWQKGYGPFTASDVVYSINRIKNPATASRFEKDLSVVKSVKAIDDYTVQFTLNKPFAPFLSAILAFRPGWIVNKQAVEKEGKQYGVEPVGTGPYQFDHWDQGNQVVLTKNPNYFKPLQIDKVVFKIIPDDTVAALALQTGEVDLSYIYQGEPATRLLTQSKSSDKFSAEQLPGYRTQWAAFNLDRPAVKDVRVRKAIIYAIDKAAAAKAVYSGLGHPVSSIFNPNIPSYIDPNPFPYNPEKAKQLLAEAGVKTPLKIDVLVMPSRGWPQLAGVLQDMWKKVGIDANLIIRERSVFDQLDKAGNYDLLAENISRADAYQYASFLYGPNIPFPNTTHYSGADQLIQEAASTSDTNKRIQLWQDFQQKVLAQDVVGFGMTNVSYVLAWRNNVTNVQPMYQDSFPVQQMSMK